MKRSLTTHCSSFLSRIHSALSPKHPGSPSTPPLSLPARGFEQVFRYLDEDGDGKISAPDLCSCMRSFYGDKMLLEEAKSAVESLDSDGDGKLGYGDFLKLVVAEEEEENGRSLWDAFAAYEMEGKGCITPKSLRQALRRLGEERTVEDCKLMVRRFDLDDDGVISFQEFKVMMLL